jgi:hypothetical protein
VIGARNELGAVLRAKKLTVLGLSSIMSIPGASFLGLSSIMSIPAASLPPSIASSLPQLIDYVVCKTIALKAEAKKGETPRLL